MVSAPYCRGGISERDEAFDECLITVGMCGLEVDWGSHGRPLGQDEKRYLDN